MNYAQSASKLSFAELVVAAYEYMSKELTAEPFYTNALEIVRTELYERIKWLEA